MSAIEEIIETKEVIEIKEVIETVTKTTFNCESCKTEHPLETAIPCEWCDRELEKNCVYTFAPRKDDKEAPLFCKNVPLCAMLVKLEDVKSVLHSRVVIVVMICVMNVEIMRSIVVVMVIVIVVEQM